MIENDINPAFAFVIDDPHSARNDSQILYSNDE